MKRVAALVLLVLAIGCSRDAGNRPMVDTKAIPMTVEVYGGGHPLWSQTVPPADRLRDVIKSVVDDPHRVWAADMNTYAPSIHVRCPGYTIDVHKDCLIVNAQDARNGSSQYVAPISPDEFEQIKKRVADFQKQPDAAASDNGVK